MRVLRRDGNESLSGVSGKCGRFTTSRAAGKGQDSGCKLLWILWYLDEGRGQPAEGQLEDGCWWRSKLMVHHVMQCRVADYHLGTLWRASLPTVADIELFLH